jgi:oxygen-independent coproporphyrinogen-3 oxidase
MKPGIYVHIPFCEQRCHYCAFTVAVSSEETFAPYVRRVVREIELAQFRDEPETIFFGGGTPSLIRGELVAAILKALPGGGSTAKEISIEANPGTLPEENLEIYRSLGINRISLGVQSFIADDLAAAGRLHRVQDSLADVETLRRISTG